MTTIDRRDLLVRVDLARLLDELSGTSARQGAGARWHCPDRGHDDVHPSVTVKVDGEGIGHWRCWSGGHGGTAIDALVVARGVSVGDAIRALNDRHGHTPLPRAPARPMVSTPVALASSAVAYVAACEQILWTRTGRPVRDWLHRRGLTDDVLVVNRVGCDPGPQMLTRAPGLPRGGVGAVFPVLDEDRTVTYLQTRYVAVSARRKYDNPSAALGSNPRLAVVRTLVPADTSRLYVTEGLPDAYTLATLGLPAVAVLGVGNVDQRVADRIRTNAAGRPIVIAFDADQPGRDGAARLTALLGGERVVDLVPPHGDMNQSARDERFVRSLLPDRAPTGPERWLAR